MRSNLSVPRSIFATLWENYFDQKGPNYDNLCPQLYRIGPFYWKMVRAWLRGTSLDHLPFIRCHSWGNLTSTWKTAQFFRSAPMWVGELLSLYCFHLKKFLTFAWKDHIFEVKMCKIMSIVFFVCSKLSISLKLRKLQCLSPSLKIVIELPETSVKLISFFFL